MLVRDVMTTDFVTVPAAATLREAIGRMLSAESGYAIVVDNDGNPGGFVTRDDVIHAVYQADPPPGEIRIVAVAHTPEFTFDPSTTVRKAARRMTDENASEVLVMDGLDLVGVLTLANIVEHVGTILQQAAASDRASDRTSQAGLDL